MVRGRAVVAACLALALGTTACQELPTAPPSAPAAAANGVASSLAADGVAIDRLDLELPSNIRIVDRTVLDAVERVINPGDYVCPPSTALLDYLNAEVALIVAQELALAQELFGQLSADLVVLADALLFQTGELPQSFGYDGEYTNVVNRTERSVKGFWDIPSDDIVTIAMKGSILMDVERVTAIYIGLGVPPLIAVAAAQRVRELLLMSNLLNEGDHPLFSFNAFASSSPTSDRIALGDGIMGGYAALGLDDVAPQAIYAHEFAHHIQFENGYFDDDIVAGGDAAEMTRYTELMADAMSAYYLTHKRGGTFNRKRVEQFLVVFFEIGDCGFASSGHHGTPNQRMKAARFGFDVADLTQKKGQILGAEEFHDLFVDFYPELIAPDV